ncbi:MAG TPA: hypothetical protein VIV59_10790 [Anaeromyxobacteraceae bacterium]
MTKALAVLALILSAACAAQRPTLSVASPRPLRDTMAEPGTVAPSSARRRLFTSSAQAVESAQAAELAQAHGLAQATGSGGR